MTPTRIPRRACLTVMGAIVVMGSVLGVAPAAQAHNYLVSSAPAAGATITALPDAFEVTTNDNLLELGGASGGFALQVRDSAGLFYGDGCVTVAGPSMTTPAELGAAGTYSVLWQLVSIDGHSVSGTYDFTWAPDAAQPLSTGSATAPVCGASVPSPESSTSALPQSAPEAGTGASTPQDDSSADILWIGGGVVGLAAVVVVVLILAGRRGQKKA